MFNFIPSVTVKQTCWLQLLILPTTTSSTKGRNTRALKVTAVWLHPSCLKRKGENSQI